MSTSLIRLYFWRHRFLMLGPGFDAGLHRHHAAQLCFSLHGSLRIRADPDEQWAESEAFYVEPDQPHEIAAPTSSLAVLYLEAESTESKLLRRSLTSPTGVARLSTNARALADLRRLNRDGGTLDEANAVCMSHIGVRALVANPVAFDPRIAQCLTAIGERLNQPLRLATLASGLGVSESWLTHRFTKAVGLPIRRYVLWQRLRCAVELGLKGATLTDAAHAAGMSDSAHLSRTFRAMFGVAPSFLFEHRDQLAVTFEDAQPKQSTTRLKT